MRRQVFAGLVFGVSLAAAGVAGVEGDRFDNATAGISIMRPPGWHTASLQQVTENRARVQMADKDLQAAMQKQATAPLFVFTKYPEPHPTLNPSIQVTLRPLGGLSEAPPEEILKTAVVGLQKAMADFAFVQAVHAVDVSGLKGAAMKATYTMRAADQQFKVFSRMWIVPRSGFAFLIGMSGPQEGPDISEDEFKAALASIKIER